MILDSGFWILDSGFWILDSGFWILKYLMCEVKYSTGSANYIQPPVSRIQYPPPSLQPYGYLIIPVGPDGDRFWDGIYDLGLSFGFAEYPCIPYTVFVCII